MFTKPISFPEPSQISLELSQNFETAILRSQQLNYNLFIIVYYSLILTHISVEENHTICRHFSILDQQAH